MQFLVDFYAQINNYHYSIFDLNYISYYQIAFAIVWNMFYVMVLNTLNLYIQILFVTHVLSDKLLRLLQISSYLSNITTNG